MMPSKDRDGDSVLRAGMHLAVAPRDKKDKNISEQDEIGQTSGCSVHGASDVPSTSRGVTAPNLHNGPMRMLDNRGTNSSPATSNSKRELNDTDEESADETAKKLRSDGYRGVGANIGEDTALRTNAETTNRISRYDNKERYATSELKRSLHGTVYQLKHLMLVVHRVWKKNYSFCLSTEMHAAEKFDDLVLEFEDDTGSGVRRFVQLKHNAAGNKTITASHLLDTKNGDFSVLKYFISWRNINNNPIFGESGSNIFILCTNIDIDKDELNEVDIDVAVIPESDEFLIVTGRASQPPRYKLLVEKDSDLWDVLKSASELHRLASVLAKRIHDSINENSTPQVNSSRVVMTLDLRTSIFKEYHFALAKEVVDIERKEFFDNFIHDNSHLSANVKKFREILFRNLKQLSRWTKSEAEIQGDLEKCVLKLSGTFGKKFEPCIRPELTDVNRFSQQFVRLMNHGAGNDNVIKIDRQKRAPNSSPERVFSDNIDKLAGHALILEAGKVKFRQLFLEGDDVHLSGNIGEFKAALKRIFFNGFGDLGKFEFQINNFKTCTEEEMSLKIDLPDDYIDDDEIEHFLKEFILAVRQPNEVELGEMIKHEMGAYSQFNLLNADFIKDSFQNEILNWFKKTGKECEFLKNKEADAFFEKMEAKLSSLITIGLNAPYPAELEKFDTRYEREISDLRNFLDDPNRTRKPILELISSKQTLLTALRVHQTLVKMDKYKKNDSYIFLHLNKLLLPKIESQVLSAFKSQGSHDLLVVDCESISEKNAERRRIFKLWDKLGKIVDGNPSKRMILIIQVDDDFSSEFEDDSETQDEKDDDIGINNLEGCSRKKLLEKKIVNFQGQVEKTSFADLLDIHNVEKRGTRNSTDLGRIIDLNTLIQLIKGEEIRIGSEVRGLEDVKDYYIDRTIFRHVTINAEIFKAPRMPDLFAISGISEDALEKLMREAGTHNISCQSDRTELASNEYVILENGREKEHFISLCQEKPSRNVHWLKGGAKKLIWKETFGYIDSLVEFEEEYRAEGEYCEPADTTCQTQDQLFTDYEQPRIIILSSAAGMGKSTFLTHVGGVMKRIRPNMLVIRIDLVLYTDELSQRQGNRSADSKNTDEAVDFLVDELLKPETHAASETYRAMIKGRGEVALLVDGFDEIAPKYADTVTELLGALAKCQIRKLCVTTRPHSKKLLEKKLGTLPHIMQPFDQENQMEFLTNYWRKDLSSYNELDHQDIEKLLRERAATVIEVLKRSINPQMEEFTGIPLQTKLVAEGFPYSEGESLPETIDIIDLYRRFIDRKYQILFSEKKPGKETNILEGDMRKITRKIYLMRHEKLALVALFDDATVDALLTSQSEVGRACQSFWDKNEDEERTGIVRTSKPVEFIHRTFAEYFAAVFLHRTLIDDERNQRVREFFVSQLLLEPEHQTIRAFMNCILIRESSAPDNEIESWEFDSHVKRDAAGQTLFHVAARECNVGILKFFLERFNNHRAVRHLNTGTVLPQQGASNTNELDIVNRLLDRRGDIDLADENGRTALCIASTTWHAYGVVKCLVEGGANIQYLTSRGETPLQMAVRSGKLDVVKYLVEEGADINCQSRHDKTPLHEAVRHCNLDIVRYLFEKVADTNCQDRDSETLLHEAARFGNFEIVRYLIEKGADINCRTEEDKSPLHRAAESGNLDTVRYLVERGADINCQDRYTETPLHEAAQSGRMDVVKYLVEKGVDINCPNKYNHTPLHKAVTIGKWDIVTYLGGRGAVMNCRERYAENPLHEAARFGNLDTVKHLVERGADINCQSENGDILLHEAILGRNFDTVRYLVEKGADINHEFRNGDTLLHKAIRFGNLDTVSYLVEKGGDINCQSRNGDTLLHEAILGSNFDTVRYLVEKGADINRQFINGDTLLHEVAGLAFWDRVRYLVEKGADINYQFRNGDTLLHEAVRFGDLDSVSHLVEKGADINCQSRNGDTLLHVAVRDRDLDIVKYLVDEGVDINFQDRNGETPLHKAVRFGNSDVAKYLVEKGARIFLQA